MITQLHSLLSEIVTLDTELVLLVILIAMATIALDAIDLMARRLNRKSGMQQRAKALGIDGSKTIPVRDYVSEIQGLAGRPDAIIIEGGHFIPVERKPFARKLRDRYVAQLLVYMRLIEEFEGKRPPYGYLILGSNCRRIKIENSEKNQQWLQILLGEMRAILAGTPANATPQPKKCEKCDVREACQFRADTHLPLTKIGQRMH